MMTKSKKPIEQESAVESVKAPIVESKPIEKPIEKTKQINKPILRKFAKFNKGK